MNARHSAWARFLKCFETGMLKWQNKDKRNSFHPYREQLEQNKKVMFDSLNEASSVNLSLLNLDREIYTDMKKCFSVLTFILTEKSHTKW